VHITEPPAALSPASHDSGAAAPPRRRRKPNPEYWTAPLLPRNDAKWGRGVLFKNKDSHHSSPLTRGREGQVAAWMALEQLAVVYWERYMEKSGAEWEEIPYRAEILFPLRSLKCLNEPLLTRARSNTCRLCLSGGWHGWDVIKCHAVNPHIYQKIHICPFYDSFALHC